MAKQIKCVGRKGLGNKSKALVVKLHTLVDFELDVRQKKVIKPQLIILGIFFNSEYVEIERKCVLVSAKPPVNDNTNAT
jgi:hypothetical protein